MGVSITDIFVTASSPGSGETPWTVVQWIIVIQLPMVLHDHSVVYRLSQDKYKTYLMKTYYVMKIYLKYLQKVPYPVINTSEHNREQEPHFSIKEFLSVSWWWWLCEARTALQGSFIYPSRISPGQKWAEEQSLLPYWWLSVCIGAALTLSCIIVITKA